MRDEDGGLCKEISRRTSLTLKKTKTDLVPSIAHFMHNMSTTIKRECASLHKLLHALCILHKHRCGFERRSHSYGLGIETSL